MQSGMSVRLREYTKQMKMGRASFDFKLHEDGKIHPATGDSFIGPNGMSLRPPGLVFQEVLGGFKADVKIFKIPKGTSLPKTLVLLHEHSDHYSLQTTEVVTETELNKRLSEFLRGMPMLTKKEYLTQYPPEMFHERHDS